MLKTFDESLLRLKNGSVRISAVNAPSNPGNVSALLLFDNGTRLRADHWRLIKRGTEPMSSFEHLRESTPTVDAIAKLDEQLRAETVSTAALDKETGDLIFQFSHSIRVQVFNVAGYEAWEITFPDGTFEFSTYVFE
jgi:hypothetical protein